MPRKSPSLVELLHSCRQARPSLSILHGSDMQELALCRLVRVTARTKPCACRAPSPGACQFSHVSMMCSTHTCALACMSHTASLACSIAIGMHVTYCACAGALHMQHVDRAELHSNSATDMVDIKVHHRRGSSWLPHQLLFRSWLVTSKGLCMQGLPLKQSAAGTSCGRRHCCARHLRVNGLRGGLWGGHCLRHLRRRRSGRRPKHGCARGRACCCC